MVDGNLTQIIDILSKARVDYSVEHRGFDHLDNPSVVVTTSSGIRFTVDPFGDDVSVCVAAGEDESDFLLINNMLLAIDKGFTSGCSEASMGITVEGEDGQVEFVFGVDGTLEKLQVVSKLVAYRWSHLGVIRRLISEADLEVLSEDEVDGGLSIELNTENGTVVLSFDGDGNLVGLL